MRIERPSHQTVFDVKADRSADPFKAANTETRSLAELTHIARQGINGRGKQQRLAEGGPPLEHGLEEAPKRLYPYPDSWA